MVFYGVYDPNGGGEDVENARRATIFEDIKDALNMMRNRKEARMRAFTLRQDAHDFSVSGITTVPSNTIHRPLQEQEPKNSPAAEAMSTSSPGPSPSTVSSSSQTSLTPFVADRPVYRGPKTQELVLFRKMIEQGKLDAVAETAWRNPRYLIGSGDTPSILKESARYNALHVAALAKNALMCEKLLDIIGDPKFIQLLYGPKNAHHCHETSCILQDLYLNMPERGRHETPLHLAVKFGAVDVVEVLTSYPQCNQTANSDGMFPIDIICFRIESDPKIAQQIRELLSGRFYVPVIRSVDNSLPPIIGEPFSPKHPPKLAFDPLSPEMEIQAFAGPMNQEEAQVFRKRWKTPPRVNATASPNRSQQQSPLTPTFALCSPKSANKAKVDKGFPSRQLFPTMLQTEPGDVTPNPNQSPPGEEMDDSTTNADLLDDSLLAVDEPETTQNYGPYRQTSINMDESLFNNSMDSTSVDSPMFKERHTKLTDSEKGLEMIGRELARERKVSWREYWPFLDCFMDIRSDEGMHRLEQCLRTRAESRCRQSESESKELLGQLCDALNDLKTSEPGDPKTPPVLVRHPTTGRFVAGTHASNGYSAYLCSEKSWQVYARRLIDALRATEKSGGHIKEALLAELRRLTALVISYQDDARFQAVEFDVGHSRFGHLVAGYLVEHCMQGVQDMVADLQRAEATFEPNSAHLCVIRSILRWLTDPQKLSPTGPGLTEEGARQLWTSESRCSCAWERVKVTGSQVNRKRISRRMDAVDECSAAEDAQRLSAGPVAPVPNGWRGTSVGHDSDGSSDDDNDEYLSADSDDDVYLTPPESLSPSESPARCKTPTKYINYVMGEEPTKTDRDVLNALAGLDVDRNTHPYLFDWWLQMQKFKVTERNLFPSLTPIPSAARNRCRTNSKVSNQLPVKCLFKAQQSSLAITSNTAHTASPTHPTPSMPITHTTTPSIKPITATTAAPPISAYLHTKKILSTPKLQFGSGGASTTSTTQSRRNPLVPYSNNNNTPKANAATFKIPKPPAIPAQPTANRQTSGAATVSVNGQRPAAHFNAVPIDLDDMANVVVAMSPKFALVGGNGNTAAAKSPTTTIDMSLPAGRDAADEPDTTMLKDWAPVSHAHLVQ